jgi:hypothetical protein
MSYIHRKPELPVLRWSDQQLYGSRGLPPELHHRPNGEPRLFAQRTAQWLRWQAQLVQVGKVSRCSLNTALHDIDGFVERCIVDKEVAGGRRTHYVLSGKLVPVVQTFCANWGAEQRVSVSSGPKVEVIGERRRQFVHDQPTRRSIKIADGSLSGNLHPSRSL